MTDTLCEDTLTELAEQVGVELIETLQEELTTDAGDRIIRMQGLLASADMENLRKEAHTLKSSCGSLGLKKLSEQAAIIERKLVTGDGPDIKPIVPELPMLLENGLSALKNWVVANS